EHRVVALEAAPGVDPDDALRRAAAAERDSEHPLARAFVRSAEERGLSIPAASEFAATPGVGVRAVVEGRPVRLGGPRLLHELGIEPPEPLRAAAETFARRGESAIYLVGETADAKASPAAGRVLAVFAVADAIRPESREAVDALHDMGIEVVMLT